jgi:hypothetical protein
MTALLAANNASVVASQPLQHHLNLLQQWYSKWKVKINQTKSVQVTFTMKRYNLPAGYHKQYSNTGSN